MTQYITAASAIAVTMSVTRNFVQPVVITIIISDPRANRSANRPLLNTSAHLLPQLDRPAIT